MVLLAPDQAEERAVNCKSTAASQHDGDAHTILLTEW